MGLKKLKNPKYRILQYDTFLGTNIFLVNFNSTHLIFSQKEILEKNTDLLGKCNFAKTFPFFKIDLPTYLSKLQKKSSSASVMERRKNYIEK